MEIHHRDTEGPEEDLNLVSYEIIGAAIEVHRGLGPGLLESAYQTCLAHEMSLRRSTPMKRPYRPRPRSGSIHEASGPRNGIRCAFSERVPGIHHRDTEDPENDGVGLQPLRRKT